MRIRLVGLVAAAAVAGLSACASPSTSDSSVASPTTQPTTTQPGQQVTSTQIRLRIGTDEATARLYDNAPARDFASLLPTTLSLHDLGGREKAGALPRDLTSGQGQSDYRAGQLGYWPPSGDLAIYYREDSFRIPDPGIVMIGEIETGLDAIANSDDDASLIVTAD